MIDYTNWELRKLSVDAVRLDKRNPRLPEEMLDETQTSIMHYLVSEFKVLEIAQSIVRNGFFINELPIVVKEGNHFVVVEGNRRITALKLLRNPDLAPPRKKHTYVRLAEDIDTNIWEKINMYIAPSKDEVAPILIARHGSEMTSPWQRIMKMRFLAGDVLKGIAYEEISSKYDVSITEVRTAAMTMLIREMIRECEAPEATKEAFLSEKFQTSTLARIIETKRFTEVTGLQVAGTKIKYSMRHEDFMNIILRICKDVDDGKVTHRTHDDVRERVRYINEIYEELSSGRAGQGEYEARPKLGKEDKSEPRKPKPRVKHERLIPETAKLTTGNQKLDDILVEGQKMSVAGYPHAGGLLLRTALDLSIQRLFEINGKLSETKHQDGKTLGLTKRINILHSVHADWFPDKETCDKFKRFTAKNSQSFVHIETLNDYVHGDYGRPAKDDLRNFWAQIMPLIDCILEES